MTRRQNLLPIIPSASRASGTSTPFPNISEYSRVMIIESVTVLPGTSLDLAVEFQDPLSEIYTRVQTRDAGQNANGAFTVGTWALGNFATVAAQAVPYVQARVLTSTEMLPLQMRLNWTVVGANATFAVAVIAETEEGSD